MEERQVAENPIDPRSDAPGRRPVVRRAPSDTPFYAGIALAGGLFLLLILGMLLADLLFTTPHHLWQALQSPEIRFAVRLSLFTCTLTMLLALVVGVPIGYLLARVEFPGKALVDVLVHIPLALPPLVVGLSLLILFQTPVGLFIQRAVTVTYAVPAIILAQFPMACALVIRTVRATFAHISPRQEQVALTLGCSAGQAFWHVALPSARRGIFTAATLAWARALGEFGPVLIFAGTTRLRTEVLPTSVFLEMSVGNIEAALAVSLLMVALAILVLSIARFPFAEMPDEEGGRR